MLLLLHHIVSACLGFALMSFLEYATHRWMLHKNHFVELFPRVREFKEVLTDHVVNHHGHFYKVFNHEEDTNGKWAGLFFPFGYYKLLTLFLATPLWFADHTSAYWCTVFFFMHFYFWNLCDLLSLPAPPTSQPQFQRLLSTTLGHSFGNVSPTN
jgi:hypothetical protein